MKKTTHTQILKMVMTALFAALTFVATYIIRIPTVTGGYIHLGDCFVLLSGWMLGPVYGVLAAGIGSMLTDIAAGYVAWAPATLVIKGLVALTGWGLYAALAKLLRGVRERSGGEYVISNKSKPVLVRSYQRSFERLLKKLNIQQIWTR